MLRKILSILTFLLATQLQAQDVNKIVQLITGRFNNTEQIQNLPDSVQKNYTQNKAWINHLSATHTLVNCKNIKGKVVYIEWREDSATGKISRQRLWAFVTENQKTYMQFYSFKNANKYINLSQNLSVLDTISMNELVTYPETCSLEIKLSKNIFALELDSTKCQIIANQSGRQMKLFASIYIDFKGFTYYEKGILTSGKTVFEVPGFERYFFKKEE